MPPTKSDIKFVADPGQNHNGDFSRVQQFITTAKESGCWGIKFQFFTRPIFRAPYISPDNFSFDPKEIRKLCMKAKLKLGFTVFEKAGVDLVRPYCDFLKLSSYELTHSSLLQYASQSGLPLVFSTGMADDEETRRAILTARENGCGDITVLHCVTNYPCRIVDAQLQSIRRLTNLKIEISDDRAKVIHHTGYSDHTRSPEVMYRACHRYEPEMVEFHLDLDQSGREYKHGHCWLPHEIKRVIDAVNTGIMSDGTVFRTFNTTEMAERKMRMRPDGLRG